MPKNDALIIKTDAKDLLGATGKDLKALEPAEQYYSRKRKCNVTLYEIEAVKELLVARHGSLEASKALSQER